ncbi:MAG: DUF1566 domain-containing protein [Proteobacteria bacterium]|nr:DUF1566 domain-containing protein [Pseudomonadota bacterium]
MFKNEKQGKAFKNHSHNYFYVCIIIPNTGHGGSLEPSAAPTVGTMHSLEDIYQLLSTKLSTMEARLATLEEKVGPRFVDNNNGTITDKRTGLVWLKNANPCGEYQNWNNAVAYCNSLASGQAGLTDGSTAGQWRLPSKEELEGIGTDPPATWESGSPPIPWTMPGFIQSIPTNVQSADYWSGTSVATNSANAWCVTMHGVYVGTSSKANDHAYVWPVRGGN